MATSHSNPNKHLLEVATPDWANDRETAATDITRAHILDPLFEETLYLLYQAYQVSQGVAPLKDALGNEDDRLLLPEENVRQWGPSCAAEIVAAIPHPADAMRLFTPTETLSQQYEAIQKKYRLASAPENVAPDLEDEVSNTEYFFDPVKRSEAYEHVLQVLYGNRFDTWLEDETAGL